MIASREREDQGVLSEPWPSSSQSRAARNRRYMSLMTDTSCLLDDFDPKQELQYGRRT